MLLGAVAGGFGEDEDILTVRKPAGEELVARAEVEYLAVLSRGQVDEVELTALRGGGHGGCRAGVGCPDD